MKKNEVLRKIKKIIKDAMGAFDVIKDTGSKEDIYEDEQYVHLNRTRRNSEIHGKIPKALRSLEKIMLIGIVCLILGLILAGTVSLVLAIPFAISAGSFFFANPGIFYWDKLQEGVFLGYMLRFLGGVVLGLSLWGILALLIYFKIIIAQLPFGEKEYAIGYSLIFGQPTTTFTDLRTVLQLRPVYTWEPYRAEIRPEQTSLKNLTTRDDSTVNGTFFFGWTPLLNSAAIVRGSRELSGPEIVDSWKGLIKQYAPDIIRELDSGQILNYPGLVAKGVVGRILALKGDPLGDAEIKKEISGIEINIDRIASAANKYATDEDLDHLPRELKALSYRLSEKMAFIRYPTEIDRLIIKLCKIHIDGLRSPDDAGDTVRTILAKIAEGSRSRIPEEQVHRQTEKLTGEAGTIIHWPAASILIRLSFEPERNPEEIAAAMQVFKQQSLNRTRRENLKSLKDELTALVNDAGISFEEARNLLLLTERPEGKDPSAKKIIVEGATPTDTAIANYLSEKKS